MTKTSDLKTIIDNQEATISQMNSLLLMLRQELDSRVSERFERKIPSNSCIVSIGLSDHDYGYAHWRSVLLELTPEPLTHEQDENGEPNLKWFDRVAAIDSDLEDYEERILSDRTMEYCYRQELLKEVAKRRSELGTEDIWDDSLVIDEDNDQHEAENNQSICDSSTPHQKPKPKTPVHKAIAAYLVHKGKVQTPYEVWKHFKSTSPDNFSNLIERVSIEGDRFVWQSKDKMTAPRSLSRRSFCSYVTRVVSCFKEDPEFFELTLNNIFGHKNWVLPISTQEE